MILLGRKPATLMALAAFCAAGCDKSQIMVVVTTDLPVTSELDAVELRVQGPNGDVAKVPRVDLRSATAPSFPLTLGVLANDDLAGVTVSAAGYLSGAKIVEQRFRTGFVEGSTRMLVMQLLSACRGRMCNVNETCGADGCVTDVKPPSSLPVWPGFAPPNPMPAVDAGPADTAPTDTAAPACSGTPLFQEHAVCPWTTEVPFDSVSAQLRAFNNNDIFTNLARTCDRSFCGASAMQANVALNNADGRAGGELELPLSPPMDLRGKHLWAAIRAEDATARLSTSLWIVTADGMRLLVGKFVTGAWQTLDTRLSEEEDVRQVKSILVRFDGENLDWRGRFFVDELGWTP